MKHDDTFAMGMVDSNIGVSPVSTIDMNITKLFSKPLPSTRSGAFYNTFPYPTKISPETIAVYIAATTSPDATVLDSFSGSGSTGLAALLCEYPTQRMIDLTNTLGITPQWGKRNAVLYEISTYGAFATKTLSSRLTATAYRNAVDDFISQATKLVEHYYQAIDPDGNVGTIRYAIWSEILICPNCGGEISYFEHGTSRNPVRFHDEVVCPHCKKNTQLEHMQFATEEYQDRHLGKKLTRKKRVLAWIYGTTDGKNWDRPASTHDQIMFEELERTIPVKMPAKKIKWGDLYRSGYHFGITHLHHFYTARNYSVMERLWKLTETFPENIENALKLLLLSYNSAHCTMMTRVVAKKNAKDFVITSAQSGVLYIGKIPVEKNILLGLKRKSKSFEDAYRLLEKCTGTITVHNSTSAKMFDKSDSLDLVFTDPPFGDFIPYAEVNQINELWLKNVANRDDEIIVSPSQNKGIDKYQEMLTSVFSEITRVIKPGHNVVIVFHAAKALLWNAFANAVKSSELEIKMSNVLDKTQASFKQVVSKGGVQDDPVFLLRKAECSNCSNLTSTEIMNKVLATNSHKTEAELRRCYSIYVGRCLEANIAVSMDAKEAYEYISDYRGEVQ